ncbi:MAG: DUF1643 domain-containing protein [Mesorhizobium sp.]|nr:MAG: DUF1643 domain-containing protein [Mesorhizobium sp.]
MIRRSAVISDCLTWRYRLDRDLGIPGLVFAYLGVNGSTADGDEEDHTTMKWNQFTLQNGGGRYITGNPYAYRAKDVRALAAAVDPIGPENDRYIREILNEADVIVPCWGSRGKLPKHLRPRLDTLRDWIFSTKKPVKIFGLTASGDPKHPLMLPYSTQLINWRL